MEDRDERYKKKLISIANDIEILRLEMYPNIKDSDENKEEFSDALFKIQSDLRYKLSEMAYLMEYKSR